MSTGVVPWGPAAAWASAPSGWASSAEVVAAADADPKAAYDRARGWRRGAVFPRPPIFGVAVAVTNAALAGLALGARQQNGRGR